MKKYRLLKDLPGYASGTVFSPDTAGGFTANVTHDSVEDVIAPSFDPSYILANPSWFEEVMEEKPYPFTPKYRERYISLDGGGKKWGTAWADTVIDSDVLALANIWRNAEDADEAARILPRYFKALQAKLNRKGWTPQIGDTLWCVSVAGIDARVPFVVRKQTMWNNFSVNMADGGFWPDEASAQAIADLLNALHQ